jgi:O-antigen/teichoic acid export membrane protein
MSQRPIASRDKRLTGSIKKIATVGVGGAAVQVLAVALTPIITRLYSPDAFAGYALYWSIASFFICVSAFRFETAIVLARSNDEAINVVVVSFGASIFNAALCFLIAPLITHKLVPANMVGDIASMLYFLPLLVIMTALNQIVASWLTRTQEFKKYAFSDVLTRLITYTTQIMLALAGMNSAIGLITGIVIGSTVASSALAGWIVYSQGLSMFRTVAIREIMEVIVRYRNLPLYLTPYTLIQTLRERTAYFLIGAYGKNYEVGFYSIAARTLALPVSLVTGAIRPIFFQKAAASKLEDLEDKVNFALRSIGCCVVPCWVILLFHYDTLFALVLGEPWRGAGIYAAILSVPAIPFLLGSWLDRSFDLLGRQKLHFTLELLFTCLSLGGLAIGIFLLENVMVAIAIQAGIATVYYSCYLIVIFRIAGFRARSLAVSGLYWLAALGMTVCANVLVSVFVKGLWV